MMWVDRLNDQRHNVSSAVSLCMVAVIWLMSQSILPLQRSLLEEPMELSLLTPEPVRPVMQAPAPPPPVQPPKTTLTPSKATPALPTPSHLLAVPSPTAPVTATPPTPAPTAPNEPAKVEAPRPVQAAPAVTPQPAAEPAKPLPPPPAPSSAAVENAYVLSVRALLNANKRYPTGREASLQRPSGKAVVWFVLNRNGTLQDAGIDDTSNSILLDNAALSTVRRTSYTPLPEGSWPGQAQHRFTVTLDFVPLN
ncbi:TonB family protein [Limnohabitans sp. Rim8]|uniref:TonB family protein n=1 Tax=Limnohabitans sp. Rim8 TaxID=1100718 RepID=UPI0026276FA6|nr:TonB family protein [Limnohabitans sp. Rim8]